MAPSSQGVNFFQQLWSRTRYTRLESASEDIEMAEDHGNLAVQMHAQFDDKQEKDVGGGTLTIDEKVAPSYAADTQDFDDKLSHDEDGSEYPTEDEIKTLRHIPFTLPARTWLVCIIELCERFCYYGVSGVFNNYIANPYGDGTPYTGDDLPGAIGRGSAFASGLQNYWQFWCYVTPIIGAVVADQFLGRYKTLVVFSGVYIAGLLILLLTSLPVAIENGAALGGLAAAMTVVGLGTGGIKSNVAPLIAEQMTETRMKIKITKTGERVIQDPNITFQRIYMIFYFCINIGSLSLIGTVFMEKYTGYWTVNLLGLLVFIIGFGVLLAGRKLYVTRPPRGSVLPHAFKAMWIGLVNGRTMEAAKPSYQAAHGQKYSTPWNDTFIDELRRGLVACKVFVFYPIFWVIYNQLNSNFVGQAGSMQLHGMPNDEMQNIDPIVIIIFIPLMDKFFYPFMRKIGFPMYPVTRITIGFTLSALSMAFAAIIQHEIYIRPPYFNAPGGDNGPNDIHVAVQTPGYILIGLSEIFASITGLEYAFTKAPASMKSFIMSMFLFTSAFGSILGIGVSTVAYDPKFLYSPLNKTEIEMNALEDKMAKPKSVGELQRAAAGEPSSER
ncbi:peptide transporter ptr2 [Lecanora helva]